MNITRTAITRSLLVAVLVGAVPATTATTSAQAAPYCGITWGSLAKTRALSPTGTVTGVRSGRHACFDRLVIDLKGRSPGFTVRYVKTFTSQASGRPIALRGGAKLAVTVDAPAYDPATGAPTYTPRNPVEVVDVTGYRTFRQVRWDSSFEGYTSMGLGVRARLPFRVFTIQDRTTSRLVIDVAHHW
ncbi:AMIN-like domain-containing (lipo)protein [Pedococcus bigeumensis]|jgi:hypothetical protein|uniref:AMIN-like domain-containing (lipo)protein n=1 Tax=Pedococcus bigeumensis TaxID=433644 RepID=UPI002FE9D504